MDHIGILERAIRTTLRHRALWVIGFLWALVGGCQGLSGSGGPKITFSGDGSANGLEFEGLHFFGRTLDVGGIVALVVTVMCAFMLLVLVMTIVKYAIQAGVYRGLDQLEGEGTAPTVRGVWREGWNRRTWRLWVQNLVVGIPLFIIAVATLLLVAAPLVIGLVAGGGEPPVAAVLISGGLFFGWLLAGFALMLVVNALKQLWWRAAVVGDESVLAGLRNGWRLARHNLSEVTIMVLLMVGAGLVWGVVVMILIAVFLLMTGGLAVLPAYLIYQSLDSLVPALLYGVPVAFLTFVVPLAIAGGLYLIFQASVWSQVYRALSGQVHADL